MTTEQIELPATPATSETDVQSAPVDEQGTKTVLDEAIQSKGTADAVSYDAIVFPDGLTTEEIQAHKDLFKSLSLTEDGAKKLLEDKSSAIDQSTKRALDKHLEAQKTEWLRLQEENQNKIKQEFGEKLPEKMSAVVTALDKFLSKEDSESFKKFQRETGIGNNPLFVKFLANIGESLSDARINPGTNEFQSPQRMYPNSNMNIQ
jgi:hypothetical protein